MGKTQSSKIKPYGKTKYPDVFDPILTMRGYAVSCDNYGRIKLMFLDDYDNPSAAQRELPRSSDISFTKSFIMNKSRKMKGKSPITEDKKYFYIKFKKKQVGIIANKNNDEKYKIVPISDLMQHKVKCKVRIKKYKFAKHGKLIQGWNINLAKIELLEW